MTKRESKSNDNPGNAESSFAEVLTRARTGDAEAVGLLLDRFRNYLLLIANSDLDQRIKTKLGASDAVQVSMLHAQQNLAQFHGDSEQEFKAWLKTILGNDIRKARRHLDTRKRKTDREVNMQDHSAVARGLLDEHLTPSSEAIEREKALALEHALARLTDDQKQLIQLRNYDRLTFREIGQRLDRSEDAVRKMWARSIEQLKQMISQSTPGLINQSQAPDE